eukprot:c4528_g1_i1.p1 GENE.c4528_g1_i1~~c4528_g1_i1.p1  ORF type:complete len:104 (+),score=28.91 c4528_g1_i1:35-346(+)
MSTTKINPLKWIQMNQKQLIGMGVSFSLLIIALQHGHRDHIFADKKKDFEKERLKLTHQKEKLETAVYDAIEIRTQDQKQKVRESMLLFAKKEFQNYVTIQNQ